jgi:vanillate O-demethylase monooxygenase subunit
VLLYRREDGNVVALRNRCPHRSFPLSRGKLSGDVVTCGYHGLAFGPDGRCTEVPSQSTVPDGLATPSYPVVERPPFIWIWMGEPEQADPAQIPDHHWLSSPDYASYSGYIHCRTNYVRLHENVLDLTHFPYVHGEAAGGLDYIRAPFTVDDGGRRREFDPQGKSATHPECRRNGVGDISFTQLGGERGGGRAERQVTDHAADRDKQVLCGRGFGRAGRGPGPRAAHDVTGF